jgi:hypothetical protein
MNLANVPSGDLFCASPKNARKKFNVGIPILWPNMVSLILLGDRLMSKIVTMPDMKIASSPIHVSVSNGSSIFSIEVYRSPGGTKSCGLNVFCLNY